MNFNRFFRLTDLKKLSKDIQHNNFMSVKSYFFRFLRFIKLIYTKKRLLIIYYINLYNKQNFNNFL